MNELNLQRQIQKALEEKPEVELVYLYGSHATGKANPFSDVDIGVLLRQQVPREAYLDQTLELGRLLAPIFRGMGEVEVVVLNNAPPLLRYEAIRPHRLLFCRRKEIQVDFEVQTLRRYFDLAHARRVSAYFLHRHFIEGTRGYRFRKYQQAA